MASYRILIVDDHPLVRSGIVSMLELEHDLTVCGEAEDPTDAMELIEAQNPDLALVDISLRGGTSGLELLKSIRQKFPRLKTLAVSMHDEEVYALRALKAGAQGYIMKQEGTERIREAIRCVLEGRTYLSEGMTQAAVDQLGQGGTPRDTSPAAVLSDRELELFELTGQGKEINEIAKIMSIRPPHGRGSSVPHQEEAGVEDQHGHLPERLRVAARARHETLTAADTHDVERGGGSRAPRLANDLTGRPPGKS